MFVHGEAIQAAARALIAAEVNDSEIAHRLGIPRTTIRDWRRPRYVPRSPRSAELCWRCWRTTRPVRFAPTDYAELLGL